jgi:hypothetical protein
LAGPADEYRVRCLPVLGTCAPQRDSNSGEIGDGEVPGTGEGEKRYVRGTGGDISGFTKRRVSILRLAG